MMRKLVNVVGLLLLGLICFTIGRSQGKEDLNQILQVTVEECTTIVEEVEALLNTGQHNADLYRIQTIVTVLDILERNIEDVGGSTSDVFDLLVRDMSELGYALSDAFSAADLSGMTYNSHSMEKRKEFIQGLRETHKTLEKALKVDFVDIDLTKELKT